MRNYFKSALAVTALALGVSAALAPTATAAEKPAVATAPAAVGNGTTLYPSYAWVHFLPTVQSDHLNVYQGDSLTTVCWVYSGGAFWDLVVDRTANNTGFTLESYLSNPSNTACSSAGITSGVTTQTWVHLHPEADWEHQVVNPGDGIRSLCSVWAYDPSSQGWNTWDVVVDNTNGLGGYTLDQYVSGATPPAC